MNSSKQGFTLIELLVVIAIIGIIATAVLVSLYSANQDARHAAFLSDVRQLQVRSNLYFQTGTAFGTAANYPDCDGGVFADAEFTRIKNVIINKTSSTVTCAIGLQGNTFAATFTSPEYGTICVDQSRVKEGVSHTFVDVDTPVECPES